MRTAILMLSVDEAHRLEHALPPALAQPHAFVLVVDNACTDDTRGVCSALGARVLSLPARLSYAAAMNRGCAEVLRDVDVEAILMLNADCVLTPGFLAAAAQPLEEQPGLGSVAPRLIRAAGPSESERLDLIDAAGMSVDRRRKNSLVGHGRAAGSHHLSAGPAFGGDGAAVLYRRAALDACTIEGELLDEDMALWATDADLAWRAQALGFESWFAPKAIAYHERFYSPGTRAQVAERHRRLQFANRLLMIAKNERAADALRDLPWLLGYEVLALGHVLLRERHLLGGYVDAWRGLPAARRRRRLVQARRRSGRRVPFGLAPPA